MEKRPRVANAPGHFLEIESGPWERGCRYFNRAGAGDKDGYSKRVTLGLLMFLFLKPELYLQRYPNPVLLR